MSLPTQNRKVNRNGSAVVRTMFRDMTRWFPRGPSSGPVAAAMPSSSQADITTGRAISLAFIQYQTPCEEAFQIHGITVNCNNHRMDASGSVTENVFDPRVRFQFYGAHPVYGGPYNILDSSFTSEVFGAATYVTTGAASAIQAVASTTGMQNGEKVRFISPAGTDVIATIQTVDSATQLTLTGSVTTTTGWVCCKIHPIDAGSPQGSNTNNIVWNFATPYKVLNPPADGKMFIGFMCEHASTHATYSETAMTAFCAPGDIIRYAVNAGAAYISNGDAIWSGTTLGTNIATATFPADPQAGTSDLTANGAGTNYAQLNCGLKWSRIP